MNETMWLTGIFLAAGAPLFVVVGVFGIEGLRERRRAMFRRGSARR